MVTQWHRPPSQPPPPSQLLRGVDETGGGDAGEAIGHWEWPHGEVIREWQPQQNVLNSKPSTLKEKLKEKKVQFMNIWKSWSIQKKVVPEEIITPQDIASQWSDQARLYLVNSVACLEINMEGSALFPYSERNLMIHFYNKVFVQIMSWTNAYIRIQAIQQPLIHLFEMYQWWSIFSYSQLSNLNTLQLLKIFRWCSLILVFPHQIDYHL